MVQMVFVHGVATRTSEAYDQEEKNRNLLFEQVLFHGVPIKIRSPRWGDLVPPMANDGASFAGAAGVAAFSALGAAALPKSDPAGSAIAGLANVDPIAALDAVYATVVDQADQSLKDLTLDDIRAFRTVSRTIEEGLASTLTPSADDEELIFNIGIIGQVGAFGAVDGAVKDAVAALADRARNLASKGLSLAFREQLNPLVGRFLGDIFAYLKGDAGEDGARSRIRALVVQSINDAHAEASKAGEALVLIGHSLGGVIIYDLLSSPKDVGLPKNLAVEAFLTVGSQPGFFEEQGLFDFKRAAGAVSTPGPPRVAAWLNIFDPIDLFGFRATPMFSSCEDFEFDSVTGLLSSHTTYFKRPQFYARARKRLRARGVI